MLVEAIQMSIEEFTTTAQENSEQYNAQEIWESKEAIQAAIARIEKDSKKASETRGQIQQQKKQNKDMADFLTFLLQQLTNKILRDLHLVFFSSDTGWPQKNINHKVIIWLFAPFYKEQIEQYHLWSLYNDLLAEPNNLSLTQYIHYLKQVSYRFHDNIALNQQRLLQLVIDIMKQYSIIDNTHKDWEKEAKDNLVATIIQELFGIQHSINIDKVSI